MGMALAWQGDAGTEAGTEAGTVTMVGGSRPLKALGICDIAVGSIRPDSLA